MKKTLLVVLFVLGAACGFLLGASTSNKAPKAEAETTPAVTKKNKSSRVEELERQLAEARAENARLRKANEEAEQAVAKAKEGAPQRPQEFNFPTNIDFNAEMRKNMTEEQYTETTNAIAGFRARLAARAKGRMDFLSAVDTSKMSAADRENHEKYLDLMRQREELMGNNKNGIPDMSTIQKMMEIQMQMGPVAKKERATLVNEVTRELGYQGDDAAVVSDTISSIYDCTSGGGLMGNLEDAIEAMGPMPGGPMGGPMPGGPGPGANQ